MKIIQKFLWSLLALVTAMIALWLPFWLNHRFKLEQAFNEKLWYAIPAMVTDILIFAFFFVTTALIIITKIVEPEQ